MAENLKTNADGKTAMIYNLEGGTPWHGRGTPVNGPMTIEVAKQIFPFTYYQEKILDASGVEIPDYKSIRISDTKKIMAVGGSNYRRGPWGSSQPWRSVIDFKRRSITSSGWSVTTTRCSNDGPTT